jgi:hypothetical protein
LDDVQEDLWHWSTEIDDLAGGPALTDEQIFEAHWRELIKRW